MSGLRLACLVILVGRSDLHFRLVATKQLCGRYFHCTCYFLSCKALDGCSMAGLWFPANTL